MSGDLRGYSRGHHEALLSALSVGFFFVLIGILVITTPNLSDKVVTFLSNWQTHQIGTTNINVPVPENLGEHIDVYLAARDFSLVWGIFLAAMLGARFLLGSPTRRKAQNVGDIVFWLGAAYMNQTFLVETTQALPPTIDDMKWFQFWAAIIALIGVSLIVRAIFLVVARASRSA